MNATSTIGIKLAIDGATQAEAQLGRVGSGMQKLGSAADGIRSSLGGLAGAFAGVVSVQQFMQAADAVTALQNNLRLATGSTTAAAQAFDGLFQAAQRSRTSFTELGNTYASIARASESLKLSQGQLLSLTETIGNAVTVSGASAQASQAALTQLGQGLASGTLRGEELNSILEQTPRLAKALADGLGVSTGALRKLGEQGKLTAEAVVQALQSQQKVLAQEVATSVTTVSQAYTQLQNAATALVGTIDTATGSSGTMAQVIQAVAASLGDIQSAFKGMNAEASDFEPVADGIGTAFEAISVLGVNVAYVVKAIGTELGGLAAQAVAVAKGQFAEAAEISRLMRADAEKARADVDALSERIVRARQLRRLAESANAGLDFRAENARLNRQAGNTVAAPLDFSKVGDSAKAAKKEVDEFAAALDKVLAKDSGLNSDYTKTLEALFAGYQKGRISAEGYADAVAKLIGQQPFVKQALDAQIKAAEAANAAWDDAFDAQEKARLANEDQIKTARTYLDQVQFETTLLGLNAEQRAVATAVRELEAKGIKEGTQAYAAYIDKIKEAIRLREGKQAEIKAAEDADAAWKKASDDIERSLTDALMRGFESGKGFAEVLRDTVANMFRTLVLRPVVQAIVSPVVGALMGGLGLSSTAAAAGSAGGSLLGSLGAGALGSTLFGGVSLSTIGSGIGAGIVSTLQGSTLSGGAAAAILETGGATGAATAGTIGAALPWLALGAVVLNGLGVFRTTKTVGGGLSGTLGSGDIQAYDLNRKSGTLFSGPDYSIANQRKSPYSEMIQNDWNLATASVVTMADSLGLATDAANGFTATLGTDTIHPDTGGIGIKLDDLVGKNLTPQQYDAEVRNRINEAILSGSEELAQKLIGSWKTTTETIVEQVTSTSGFWEDMTTSTETVERQVTKTEYVVSEYARSNETALQTLTRLATSLSTVNDMFDLLNLKLLDASPAGAAAASAIADANGGLENFKQLSTQFFTDFYSETEQKAETLQRIATRLQAAGLNVDAEGLGKLSRDEWRDAYEYIVATQGAASEAAVAILATSPAFASVTKSADDAAKELEQAAEKASKAAEDALGVAQKALDDSRKRAEDYFKSFSDAAASAADTIGGAAKNIRSYLADLDKMAPDGLSLASARSAFNAQLVLAKGGDREALDGITGYADTLLRAIQDSAGSATEARVQQARVRAQLAALPGQVSAEQFIVNAIERQTLANANALTTNFQRLDANLDGLLTFEELKTAGLASDGKLGDVIAALDTNGDGQISAIEALAGTLATKFDQLDTSLDGALSFDEFRTAFTGLASDATLQSIFRELDVNGDGVISRIEASNINTANTVAGLAALGQQLGGQLAAGFDSIDLTGNGLIDYNEFRRAFAGMATDASLQAIFKELDTNGDGTITRLEAIRGSTGETASNTYGLDKLTRISDVINSLQWGTPAWDAASISALGAVASQNGWTAEDLSNAIGNRFSPAELLAFFQQYGGNIALGGLGLGTAASGSTTSAGAGGFVIGGATRPGSTTGAASSTAVGASRPAYAGALGTPITDPTAVARLDSINGYVNTLDWGTSAGTSAWATYQAAQQYGVSQQELAVATGYNIADIQALFDAAGVPRFAAGGMHSGGLRLVGEQGPELELTGPARYINTAETMSLLRSGGASNAEMLAEMRAMREDNQAQARAMVQLQQRLVKLQERWDAQGMPETRVET